MSTKPSKKRQSKNDEIPAKTPAMPGVILLLQKTAHVYRTTFPFIFGYISWLLIPIAISIISYLVLEQESFAIIDLFFGVSLFTVLSVLISSIFIKSMPFLLFKKPVPLPLVQKATLLAFPYFVAMIVLNFATYAGLILLIVPGILISVWFVFAPIIILLEERPLMEAFRSSREAVRGRFLAILWRHYGGHFVILTMQGAVFITLLFLTSQDPARIFETPLSFHQDIIFRLVGALFLPISPIYTTLLYISLRER